MPAQKLPSQPKLAAGFKKIKVKTECLVRISRHTTGEPFFGKHAGNRFDDPAKVFGTCYFGRTLAVAFAETILHDRFPDKDGGYTIPLSELESRCVYTFTGPALSLADLSGSTLKKLGGTLELIGTASYKKPQAWSAAIHGHKACIDGLRYPSRHLSTKMAYVVYDRFKELVAESPIKLTEHPDFAKVIDQFGVKAC